MRDKKQQLLECAMTLFYQKGVNSVGINEILASSGISKKTLYSHFESKESLILATLHLRSATFLNWLRGSIADSKNDKEVVEKIFDALSAWFNNQSAALGEFKGCFFINVAYEYRSQEGPVTEYCKAHKQELRAIIKDHLSTKSKDLLETICILIDGAINQAYVCEDLQCAQHSKKLINKVHFA